MSGATPEQVRRIVLQRLESLARAGVTGLPRPARPIAAPRSGETPAQTTSCAAAPPAPQDAPREAAAVGCASPNTAPPAAAPLSREQRVAALAAVCRDVAACRRCAELAATRTQTVFGAGNPMPRLVFLGEAPGAEEDLQGVPFVGRAGQLLQKILAACALRRDDVYILNILKCRPPGNRTPTAEEAENCREFLLRQLAILQPEFICCLGAVPAQNLLHTSTPVGRLRGRFHRFQDSRVLVTYHPAYLLRNPNARPATWEDMKMLLREMGIQLPQP